MCFFFQNESVKCHIKTKFQTFYGNALLRNVSSKHIFLSDPFERKPVSAYVPKCSVALAEDHTHQKLFTLALQTEDFRDMLFDMLLDLQILGHLRTSSQNVSAYPKRSDERISLLLGLCKLRRNVRFKQDFLLLRLKG